MQEEWKDIKNYEGLYQVSNFGRIKSMPKKWVTGNGARQSKPETIMSPSESQGYCHICLSRDKKKKYFSVHSLVWDAFGDSPRDGRKLQVDHIDGDKTNNHINNLQLLTARMNVAKAKKKGLPTGVYYSDQSGKYIVHIVINGKNIYMGSYNSPSLASAVYQTTILQLGVDAKRFLEYIEKFRNRRRTHGYMNKENKET